MFGFTDDGIENKYLIAGAGKIDNPAAGRKIPRQPAIGKIGIEDTQPFLAGKRQRVGKNARQQCLAVARLIGTDNG
ncbi:hypothetical protein [Salaquimonas pukyongi]|uniref:hypothetical protein n=1 Tax=Salaquimonas pukyongi TaxID=2712698 RepID=UPI00096B6B16|nr:hypothetical protein [Salaquimonas pukyongi]